MLTEGRVHGCSRTTPTPAQEALPVDLLLEIVALADIATVVRCAATGRILRRAILDPAFRRRLALAAANDGFDPALLLAVSYREKVYSGGNVVTHRLIHTSEPAKLRVCLDYRSLQGEDRDSFKPAASRDGLLILRRLPYDDMVELLAHDILTRVVITSLPPTTLPNAGLHVVVLSVGDAGRSFELLVADMNIRFYRTFSSKDSQWSATRQVVALHSIHPWDSCCSVVIGRTVYWPRYVNNACHWDHILALDVDSGEEATLMELPPACFSRMMTQKRDKHLLLAPVHGRLCLLVAESRGVAMWTLKSSVPATWSRQVVISSVEIARQARLPVSFTLLPLHLVGFGERSGAVILDWGARCERFFFLRLDLGTNEEVTPVVTRPSSPENAGLFTRFFMHEIDLVSLLQAMKSF